MITQEKAKTNKFAYLNFLKCQPSWIKTDLKMVLYNGLSKLDNITKLDKVIHWLSLIHWIK